MTATVTTTTATAITAAATVCRCLLLQRRPAAAAVAACCHCSSSGRADHCCGGGNSRRQLQRRAFCWRCYGSGNSNDGGGDRGRNFLIKKKGLRFFFKKFYVKLVIKSCGSLRKSWAHLATLFPTFSFLHQISSYYVKEDLSQWPTPFLIPTLTPPSQTHQISLCPLLLHQSSVITSIF